ncbi:MAG TPA: hypothetical protein VGK73_21210 [Polyangiaceae bacterium]
MGFSSRRAEDDVSMLAEGEETYLVHSGELSNGDTWFIDHYAVVTGYMNLDGEDVIFVNTGQDHDDGRPQVNIPYVWNPGGRWVHLITVDVPTGPSGDSWCMIDRGVDASFNVSSEVDPSWEWVDVNGDRIGDIPSYPIGERCGVVRDSEEFEYYPHWSGVSFECDPFGELEQDLEEASSPFYDVDAGGRGTFVEKPGLRTPEWIPPP